MGQIAQFPCVAEQIGSSIDPRTFVSREDLGVADCLPRLIEPPIAFAHRGARAHARENTIESFALAVEMGATGIESDVWSTADGQAVLEHDPVVRTGLRLRRIQRARRDQLPRHIPTIEEYFERVNSKLPLSLDVKDVRALEPTLSAAKAAGALDRLWLCHPSIDVLAGWVGRVGDAKLVHSTHLRAMKTGPEAHADCLRKHGIDAVNLHHSEWTGGMVTLFHRFEIVAFGWDAQHPYTLEKLLRAGIDGLFSDYVDVMMESIRSVADTS